MPSIHFVDIELRQSPSTDDNSLAVGTDHSGLAQRPARQESSNIENSSYWSFAPRRFVLAGCAFILGTAYSAFQLHWVIVVLTAFFLIGLVPLFGFRARSTLLVTFILLVGYGNVFIHSIPQQKGRSLQQRNQIRDPSNNNLVMDNQAHQSKIRQRENVKPTDWAGRSRKSISEFMKSRMGPENGSLLASMVLGNRAINVERKTKIAFRKSGLSHVLAASGFNLSILVASAYFVCRWAMLNAHVRALISFSIMTLFLLLAGASPSVDRAFAMGSLMLLADTCKRSAHLPAVLIFSASTLLAISPHDIADVGLQLSYLSTAGLIIFASQVKVRALEKMQCSQGLLHSIIFATLIAQAFVLPLQLFYFQQFNPYFLLANCLAAPFLPTISIAGFASTAIFLIESCFCSTKISSLLLQLCYWPVETFRQIAVFISTLPFAQMTTAKPPIIIVLAYYALLFAWSISALRKSYLKWLIIISTIFSVVSTFCLIKC